MKITNCKVNHVTNPVGFEIKTPVFTWITECETGEEEEKIVSTLLRVSETSDPAASKGWELSGNLNALGQEMEIPLEPRTRYYFTVEETFESGLKVVSPVHFFETAKMEEPWTGRWITCDRGDRHPVFSKSFTLEKPVRKARLYMTGLGLFDPEIDGKPVSCEVLAPFCTDYASRIQYLTYDVTDALTKGNHSLSVTLGDGWYMGRFGFRAKGPQTDQYDTVWKLIGELHIEFEDGEETLIPTDDTWTITRSPITFSNIYDGEHRDDTLPDTAPEKAAYLPLEDTEKLHLQARLSMPVRIVDRIPARELLTTPAGEKVFDLGQEITGVFALKLNLPAGAKVHIETGEVLQNGNFYNANLRSAKSEYFYTANGTPVELVPRFTFYGYRYLKVDVVEDALKEGIVEIACGQEAAKTGRKKGQDLLDQLKTEDLTGLALSSDLDQVGSLKTGNEKLNRLIQNIFWGQRDNFLDVPTDCPQRDERMGWTADTQVFVPTACFNMDTYAFYQKYLTDLRSEQKKFGGMVPDVIPAFGVTSTSSVWGDACCIIPWTLYTMYGDPTVLKDSLPSMMAWVDYITGLEDQDHAWQKHFHYGDWLALDDMNDNPQATRGATDEAFIALTYYKNSADLIVKAAKVLGKTETVEKYQALSDRIYQEILQEYFTPNGRLALTTQTGYVLALYYDLTPDREKALKSLLQLLQKNHHHFKTGFVGTPLICKVLSSENCDEQAYEILHNEEYPGWLYEVNLGATTVWERWNSLLADGTISGINMNSMNHYAYGSIGEWMWRTLAGLQPSEEAPGFKKVRIRIVPDKKTGSCQALYQSPSGTYQVSWKVESQTQVSLQVTVPYGCQTDLTLVHAVGEEFKSRQLTAGSYTFTVETEPLWKAFSLDDSAEVLLSDPRAEKVLMKYFAKVAALPASMRKLPLSRLLEQKSQSQATRALIQTINEELARIQQ